MKQTIIKISTIAGFLFFAAGTSFAASMTLSNGGLGQVATKPSQFGVAVCNKSGTDHSNDEWRERNDLIGCHNTGWNLLIQLPAL
jgi:hypothetical protein